MLRKLSSIFVLCACFVPVVWTPAQKRSEQAPRQQGRTSDPGNKLESFLPASALAVVTIPDIRTYQTSLAGTIVASSAKESTRVEPIESLLNELVGKIAPAGMRGAIVCSSTGTQDKSDDLSVATIVEGSNSSGAQAAFETVANRIEGGAKSTGDRGVQLIKHKRGEREYELARADRFLIYGLAQNVDQMLEASRGRKRLVVALGGATDNTGAAGDALEVYVDLAGGSPMVGKHVSGAGLVPDQFTAMLEPALQFLGISSFKHLRLASRQENGVVADDVEVRIDWDKSGLLGSILKPPSLSFQRAALLPPNTLGYFSSGLDLTRVYDQVLSSLGPLIASFVGRDSTADAIAGYENELGFKIRDGLLASLGPEYAIALLPGRAGDRRGPGEEFVAIVEVKNAELVRTAMRKLLTESQKPNEKKPPPPENYRGVELVKLDQDNSVAMHSGAAYLGRTSAVKRVIDMASNRSPAPTSLSWLGSLRPMQSGRSMEFIISREGFQWDHWTKWLGPTGPNTLADLLAKRSPSMMEGYAMPHAKGLTVAVRSPMGVVTSLDAYRAESVIRSGIFGESRNNAKPPSTEIAGLIWLANQFAEGR